MLKKIILLSFLFFPGFRLFAQKIDSLNCDSFYLPNTVTPNCESYNCDFIPRFICGVPEKFELSIYDRWGELVFTSTNASEGWNGENKKNNVPCADGVYVYLIKYSYNKNEKLKERSGHVCLIR